MRYFLDTEFWEQPGSIQLISLALVCEDGRELYLENSDFIWGDCTSEWLHLNVKPVLRGGDSAVPYVNIAQIVFEFILDDHSFTPPEFWAYYADYDWVVFCWIFGSMMDLPKGYPMFCMDLKQEVYKMGNPPLPPQTSTGHNALDDARWTRDSYNYISKWNG